MDTNRSSPIGVFDSGVGGLSVVREMLQQMPAESFVYFADTAHVPYGSKEPEEIRAFASDIVSFLRDQNCKMIIIACNTTNSLAYQLLVEKFNTIPFVGVIDAGVDNALEITRNKRIGLLATVATVKSKAYQHKLLAKDPDIRCFSVECPRFVPFVENGIVAGEELAQTAREYLGPIIREKADTLILGCTHYPFLIPMIKSLTRSKLNIVDPAQETVRRAIALLKAKGLDSSEETEPVQKYFVSGNVEDFAETGSKLLGHKLQNVEKAFLKRCIR